MKLLSRVQVFATPWTVAYQASQSMESSKQDYWSGLPFPSPKSSFEPLFWGGRVGRQEYWSGLPFPSPGDLPDPGIEPLVGSPAL